jgi:hypothetical protein
MHFPVKKIKFNSKYHKINQFMTAGILISRRNKFDLQKKALSNPVSYMQMYKNYRNMYNSVVRASKKLYIEENFKKYQKNAKKTWDF